MKRVAAFLFVCAIALPSTAFASVAFGIFDGRVALIANDATLAEILTAWSSIGKTRIVNIDRLATTRITMEWRDVNEDEALQLLLRSTNGYFAVPRARYDEHLSRFDRIAIMPAQGAAFTPETRAMIPGDQRQRFMPSPPQAEENADDVNTQIDPETAEEPPQHPNGAPTFTAYPLRPLPKPAPADGLENPQLDSTTAPPPSAPPVPDGSTAARPGVIMRPRTMSRRRPGH